RAFVAEIGRHIAAVAVDHVTTEAAHCVHDPSSLAGWLVLRLLHRGDAHGWWLREGAVCLCQQGSGDGVDLLRRQVELRRFERRAKGARVADFRSDVAVEGVLHAGCKSKLVERLATDARQLRCKVLGLLDAVDFMATGAAVLHYQPLAMFNLLRGGGI